MSNPVRPVLLLLLSLALAACSSVTSSSGRAGGRIPAPSLAIRMEGERGFRTAGVKQFFEQRLETRLYGPGGFSRGDAIVLRWKPAARYADVAEATLTDSQGLRTENYGDFVEATFVDQQGRVLARRFFDGFYSYTGNERRARVAAPTGVVGLSPVQGAYVRTLRPVFLRAQSAADDLADYTFKHFAPTQAE